RAFARCRLSQVASSIAMWRFVQKAREFLQCTLIDITLEFNDNIQRYPVFMPAPRIEFRVFGHAQVDVAITSNHAEQKPDLFLATIMPADFTLDEMVWNFVAQPVACATDDFDVLCLEADFLLELAVHGLFRRFAELDAALWKLPRVLAHTLAPPHLILCIEQNDADVRAKAFTIQHIAPCTFCG